MVAGFYVTMKCNFRCTYCDDGSGNMYPDIPEQRLNTARTIEVLEILRRASAGNVDTRRGAAQNFERFNRPGCVQPLLGNVRVHVARPVIAIGAAKIALHRDVEPGDHRLDEFLVRAAAIARVQDIGEKSVDELIGNSAHRILFGYPGWGSS